MGRLLTTQEEAADFLSEVQSFTNFPGKVFSLPADAVGTHISLGDRLSIECSLCRVCVGEDKNGRAYEEKEGLLTHVLVGDSNTGKKALAAVVLCSTCAQTVRHYMMKERNRELSRA